MRSLTLLAILAACEGDPGTADLGPGNILEQDTGHAWQIRWHRDLPTAAWLEGATAPLALTTSQALRAGRAFVLRYADLFGLSDSGDLDDGEAAADELGMLHVRFTQRHAHLPVWGSELRLHFARDGTLVRVHGRSFPVGDPETVPVRSAEDARVAAMLDARALRPEVDAAGFSSLSPQLWLLPTETQVRLAWRVQIDIHDGTRPMVLETFVDAGNGAIRQRSDLLRTLTGHGTGVFGQRRELTILEKDGDYWLEDPSRGTSPSQKTYTASQRSSLPGSGVHSNDPEEWDRAGAAAGSAVDAHASVAQVWDYFRAVHGRAGWDGHGHGVHSTVHFGTQLRAAFFDGHQLVFGDGDASLSPPAAALDVVAHEYTHGLVQETAQLSGEGETGALQEAVCDLFACLITGDWSIGETIFHPRGQLRPLRNLQNPAATGNPETLTQWVPNGDAHLNSTIASHAGFLMARDLGGDAAARIWYRALTRYLTSRAELADAADSTIAAARDFGRGEETTVRNAWIAVGVVSE